jgi:hypothetical protein
MTSTACPHCNKCTFAYGDNCEHCKKPLGDGLRILYAMGGTPLERFIVCIKPPPSEVVAEGNLALRAPCLPLSGESKPPAMRVVVDLPQLLECQFAG